MGWLLLAKVLAAWGGASAETVLTWFSRELGILGAFVHLIALALLAPGAPCSSDALLACAVFISPAVLPLRRQ